ncbi:hypothetical protein Hanom_Chr03g00182311 [Helianthus anomalus]
MKTSSISHETCYFARKGYLKMDVFMNTFSDIFAFTGSTGDDTSNNTNENVSNPSAKKTLSDALSVESG